MPIGARLFAGFLIMVNRAEQGVVAATQQVLFVFNVVEYPIVVGDFDHPALNPLALEEVLSVTLDNDFISGSAQRYLLLVPVERRLGGQWFVVHDNGCCTLCA